MANAIYKKEHGRPTYLENKMVKDIEDKRSKNPSSYNYGTATTKEELQKIHTNYVLAEETEIISETKNPSSEDNSYSDMDDISDPHNESAPKIRDYVKEEGFSRDGNDLKKNITNNFEQPTNFDDAFNLPSDDDIEDDYKPKEKANDKSTNNSSDKSSSKRKESVNPDFDDMSPSAQKKETKEFAKILVDGGCAILEQGIVWYTTKDFTDSKLIQMSLDGEIDLDLLISLDSRQQATVREFFNQMEVSVKEGAKFTDEYKESLTRSLYKVMLEKGIAPTPMQSLLANIGKGLFEKFGLIVATKIQANSVLQQLKEMKLNSGDYNVSRASDSNEQPLTAEGVEELFKEEETNESAPTNDEGEE